MPEIVRVALAADYFRTLTALPQTAIRDLPKQDAPVTIIMQCFRLATNNIRSREQDRSVSALYGPSKQSPC
jgi:hypothetical protein